MKISVLTLFPEYFEPLMTTSILKRAKEKDLFEFETIDFRQFTKEKHGHVDDTPYGGGDGMLLMIEPLVAALEFAREQDPTAKVLLMTPTDNIWHQQQAASYAASDDSCIIICGRYEGFDARIDHFIDEKISVGRYVLTGGEIPAMIVIDSVVRLMPGVLGGETSAEIESYSEETELEFPQYTRPETFRDMQVPEVLLSGNHAAINKWRDDNSVKS